MPEKSTEHHCYSIPYLLFPAETARGTKRGHEINEERRHPLGIRWASENFWKVRLRVAAREPVFSRGRNRFNISETRAVVAYQREPS